MSKPLGEVRPMLAVAGELPSDDAQWAYEMKWDGIRALAYVSETSVRLVGRSGRDLTASYPELQGLADVVGARQAVLDGEVVAFGADAWPSFEVLQQRMNISSAAQVRQLTAEIPVTYLAFDVLALDGQTLTAQPYQRRRELLEGLALEGGRWQTPPAFFGVSGSDIQAVSRQHGLEGIMAKRIASRYEPGKRTASWRKIKNTRRQEVVVGGWKPGEGNRASLIGSLIIGVYEGASLVYAGHVGTGFTDQSLRALTRRLEPLRRPGSPFGTSVPPEHARHAVWVEPSVVVEVEFGQWTASGRLRAAAYLGVRDDKDAADVVRE